MPDVFTTLYKPDVLSCLADLSNDEVFTPPSVVNDMLDMLPQELFESPDTTFLDPVCKSGVFLREIAKRLIKGLEDKIPDLQERIDHIFQKQLYGIAITELTSLLSRRSVYCSKYPNSKYSVSQFADVQGNIRYKNTQHEWVKGKCCFCGATESEYGTQKRDGMESHAYEFIHTTKPQEIYNMKFDVIIGNPPYQLSINEAGKGLGAIPLYQKFIEQSVKLKPKYLTMIIPARWYAGGVGLDDFRYKMLNNKHIKYIVDFTDSKDCFPGVDINGGICYFLMDFQYEGNCLYKNYTNGKMSISNRNLSEFDIFVRRNEAVSIIHKVLQLKEKTLSSTGGCSPQTPYGLLSTFVGNNTYSDYYNCAVLGSKGWSYINSNDVLKSNETITMWKPMISKLSSEHAGNPDKNGMYRVLSRMEILKPYQICTQSYLTICPSHSIIQAQNTYSYLKTKFVRFLLLQTLVGMNLSINNFRFIPWQDFSKPWTDAELYAKYKLSQDEIDFIESMIRPME